MKKGTLALAVVGLVLFGRNVGAVNPGNPVDVEVWAQMSNNLQITVTSSTTYDFGTFTSNQQKVMTTAFDVQNTGGGLTETYQLKANASQPSGWTLFSAIGNPGANAFAIDALFNTAVPGAAAFNDATDRLGLGYGQADGTKFFGDQTGVSTANLQTEKLWLRFTAPSSAASSLAQRIQVDINAVTP